MAWRKKMQNKANGKPKAEFTTDPVPLCIGVAEDRPWGFGWVGRVQTQAKALLTIKSQSPVDEYTYWLGWDEELGLWLNVLPTDHPAYCSLEVFLTSDLYLRVANDPAICSEVLFFDGAPRDDARINVAEAVTISKKFTMSTDDARAEPPPTQQAKRQRGESSSAARRFGLGPACPAPACHSHGQSKKARRRERRRAGCPGAGILATQPSFARVCAAESRFFVQWRTPKKDKELNWHCRDIVRRCDIYFEAPLHVPPGATIGGRWDQPRACYEHPCISEHHAQYICSALDTACAVGFVDYSPCGRDADRQ